MGIKLDLEQTEKYNNIVGVVVVDVQRSEGFWIRWKPDTKRPRTSEQ